MKVDPKDNPHGHPIPDYWDDLTDDEKRFLLDAPVVDIVPHGGTGVVASLAQQGGGLFLAYKREYEALVAAGRVRPESRV